MNFHSTKHKIDFLSTFSSFFDDIVAEFDSSQFVTTQSIHESTKRGNRQVILVDVESWCETRKICKKASSFHGNIQIRKATRASQEACWANAKWSVNK